MRKTLQSLRVAVLAVALVLGAGFLGFSMFVEVPVVSSDGQWPIETALADPAFDHAISAARDHLADAAPRLSAPSISVAVFSRGQLVWSEAGGYARIEGHIPATPQTLYPIGSVSKSLTGTLVVKLAEQGKLDLDRDIRDYLPAFPEKRNSITLRQLLSHQAGIRHYRFAWQPPFFSEAMLNRHFSSVVESLSLFQDDPLLFEPDTDFHYSTFGYTLVSGVTEAALGDRYFSLLSRDILIPLGLKMTQLDDKENRPTIRATGYGSLFSRRSVFVIPASDSSYKWAGGGLMSTPTELALFGNAVLTGSLLGDDATVEMWTARRLKDGTLNPQHYGLGWRIGGMYLNSPGEPEREIVPAINHGGSGAGFTSVLLVLPEQDLVVALCTNVARGQGSGPLLSTAAEVARQFMRHGPKNS